MKRIVIDLAQNYQRPVFKLKSLNNINVLIDTGSRKLRNTGIIIL